MKRGQESTDIRSPKHARTDATQDSDSESKCRKVQGEEIASEKLQDVHLPASITALPHVMSHLNTLLLTPQEAAEEAAKTGNFTWLTKIFQSYNCEGERSLVAAATNGHLTSVDYLFGIVNPEKGELSQELLNCLQEAATGAARNGHLLVLQFIMSEMIDTQYTRASKQNSFKALLPAFNEASANGHLDVVEYMIGHAQELEYTWAFQSFTGCDAVSMAILEQHYDVAELLLSFTDDFCWKLFDAAILAANMEQKNLVDRIYQLYPKTYAEENLLVGLAKRDHVETVEYLYENGYNDLEVIAEALVQAAMDGATDAMTFLLETGRITAEIFDKAFEVAAASDKQTDGFKFLYLMKRASPTAISRAFTLATRVTVVELLHENEDISDEFIIAAFRKAFTCKVKYDAHLVPESDQLAIFKLLFKEQCISVELIGEAFAEAAKCNCPDILDAVREDPRLSSKARGKAFVIAATYNHLDLMQSLDDVKIISPELLLETLMHINTHSPTEIAEDIVEHLCNKERTPPGIRHNTFVRAARKGSKWILNLLNRCENGVWPLKVLKEALENVWNESITKYVRDILCDQLLSRKMVCACGHVIESE